MPSIYVSSVGPLFYLADNVAVLGILVPHTVGFALRYICKQSTVSLRTIEGIVSVTYQFRGHCALHACVT